MKINNTTTAFAYLLAAISASASIILLMLSGWFIAASALAGLSTAGLVFNYVVPAASIRLLAFVRIISHYGANYIGHDSLLLYLHGLRLRLFGRALQWESCAPIEEEVERLNQDVDKVANKTLAVNIPLVSGLCLAMLIGGVLSVFSPVSVPLFSIFMLMVMIGFMVLYRAYLRQLTELNNRSKDFLATFTQALRGASLWSMSDLLQPSMESYKRLLIHRKLIRVLTSQAESLLLLCAYAGIVVALWSIPDESLGSPFLILLPLVLLAVPEWLAPVMRAQLPRAEACLGQQHLDSEISRHECDEVGLNVAPLVGSNPQPPLVVNEMQLIDFAWQRGQWVGSAISSSFKKGQLIGVQGDSGCGKTSLLLALAGLLGYQGRVEINKRASSGPVALHSASIHYSEQMPVVLSDSLRNNLRIASANASDAVLSEALSFACLDYMRDNLDEWLGEHGRTLSGGERKRLGLARAWLVNADVWMLDEPFEGLDEVTAKQLAGHLENIIPQHIVLLVSHRPVSNLHYDQTIMLSEPTSQAAPHR
ncbi:ATP-binding cassette domain-containing protein [Aurantivibrio plasticivorans]